MATAKFIEIIRSDDNNTSYHNLYKVISVDGITGKYTFSLEQVYEGVTIERGSTLVVNKSVSQTISVIVSDGITSATATTKIFGFNGQLNIWKTDLENPGSKLRKLSSNAGNELYKKSVPQK